jgi:hypothetical protein
VLDADVKTVVDGLEEKYHVEEEEEEDRWGKSVQRMELDMASF